MLTPRCPSSLASINQNLARYRTLAGSAGVRVHVRYLSLSAALSGDVGQGPAIY